MLDNKKVNGKVSNKNIRMIKLYRLFWLKSIFFNYDVNVLFIFCVSSNLSYTYMINIDTFKLKFILFRLFDR